MTELISLEEYVCCKWRERFNVEELSISGLIDLSSIEEFMLAVFTDYIVLNYPYVQPSLLVNSVKRVISSKLYELAKRKSTISLHDVSSILSSIFREFKLKLRGYLKNRGVYAVTDYSTLRTLFKSIERWKILKILASRKTCVHEIACETSCREEVVRRILGELKKLGVLQEEAVISKSGKAVKTYYLKTPVILIDLRQISLSDS